MLSAIPFRFSAYTPRRLEIIDTTLREGAQTSLLYDHYKHYFSQEDKVEITRALILYGVKFIEMFAPVVSPQEREDIGAIQAVRDDLITQKGYTFLLAHVRCHPADVESAIEAGFDGLNFYIGTSAQSRVNSHGNGTNELIRTARTLIEQVRQDYPHLILRFSGEDAFRTHDAELYRVYDEIAPLVDRLGAPDTVGVATPALVARRVGSLRLRYPGVALEGHFHDDRGLAVVNALEAVRCGIRYVNTSVLGIGERSGITSMTALLFNLLVDRAFDHLEGYQLRGSYPFNVMVASKLNKLVPSKEPVSLTNRTHTGGVHQKAILTDLSTYEAHPLDQFGVTESEMLLGPLSGWNAVYYFLKEIQYFRLDENTARDITKVFKQRVYDRSGQHPSKVLIEIAEGEFGLQRKESSERYLDAVVQRMDSQPQSSVGNSAS